MAQKSSKPNQRKPRTDGQRNRERILEVAKEAFTRRGADASLDDIAKETSVGAGTLSATNGQNPITASAKIPASP